MNAPRRIVFMTTGLLTGGAEMMLFQLASRLDRKEFEPVVVSLRAEGPLRGRFESAGIEVLSPDMNPAKPNPIAWWRLVRLLQKLKPEVLQGWMYHANVASAWCSKFLSGPQLLFCIHNSIYDLRDEKRLTAWIIKRGAALSARCDRIIYCATSTARQHEELGYDPQRSLIIHNGFDTEAFHPDSEARCRLQNELQLNANSIAVGLIARFDPHKDHENFFAAARIIADSIPEARFVLAGKGIDAGNSSLNDMISRHALSEHVCLLGERSDIPRIMAGLDILLSSSSSEALPSVVGEALACEVPCVVTDVGDSRLLVGDSAFVAPARDARALAAAALKLCALSAEQRRAIGAAGRAHIVQDFSISTMVHTYSGVYRGQSESKPVA